MEEANERLLKEQEKLTNQAKSLEETLLSDKDHRLQAAKRVCSSLQQEVFIVFIKKSKTKNKQITA